MAQPELIDAPCPKKWQNLKGDRQTRFCETCQHDVHNLSAMTRAEARTLLKNQKGRLCVRYQREINGAIAFKKPTSPLLIGAAAVTLTLAGCTAPAQSPEPPTEQELTAFEDGHFDTLNAPKVDPRREELIDKVRNVTILGLIASKPGDRSIKDVFGELEGLDEALGTKPEAPAEPDKKPRVIKLDVMGGISSPWGDEGIEDVFGE